MNCPEDLCIIEKSSFEHIIVQIDYSSVCYGLDLYYKCPRGVMDNTEDSGSSAGGSIPSEGAILLFQINNIIARPCWILLV